MPKCTHQTVKRRLPCHHSAIKHETRSESLHRLIDSILSCAVPCAYWCKNDLIPLKESFDQLSQLCDLITHDSCKGQVFLGCVAAETVESVIGAWDF